MRELSRNQEKPYQFEVASLILLLEEIPHKDEMQSCCMNETNEEFVIPKQILPPKNVITYEKKKG